MRRRQPFARSASLVFPMQNAITKMLSAEAMRAHRWRDPSTTSGFWAEFVSPVLRTDNKARTHLCAPGPLDFIFRYEVKCRNAQNSVAKSMIEIGEVNTHAIIRLRTVAH